MHLQEAYDILSNENPTFEQLLEAYGIIREEKGYLLAIGMREVGNDMQLEPKIWKLLLASENLKIKIKNKIQNTN